MWRGEINLENFTDSRFATSEYVLNSPRSIRACHIVGVEPQELLPRPVESFPGSYLEKYTAFMVSLHLSTIASSLVSEKRAATSHMAESSTKRATTAEKAERQGS